jgi:glycosyltransferase involved in cell wall biosynthesis
MQSSCQGKLAFLGFVGPNYSRSATILNFESPVFEKEYFQLPSSALALIKYFIRNRKNFTHFSAFVVTSPCQKITPIAKLLLGKKVISDAGWPLIDGLLARGFSIRSMFKFPYLYFVDYISFRFSDLIFLETEMQVLRSRKLFKVNPRKIKVRLTGINEKDFEGLSEKSHKIDDILKFHDEAGNRNIILFRGKINKESGFKNIVIAAEKLRDLDTFIFVTDKRVQGFKLSSNCFSLCDITNSEMSAIYRVADISLGQLSDHKRLNYTIPHKAFEAGFFGKPFIGANARGLREYLNADSAIFLKSSNSDEIVTAINSISSREKLADLSAKILLNHDEVASQETLNWSFDREVMNLLRQEK